MSNNYIQKCYHCILCCQTIDECDLPVHLLIHLEGKLCRCELCVLGFETKEFLTQHLLQHVGNILHVVDAEDPPFVGQNEVKHESGSSRESNLTIHDPVHNDENPRKSESCNQDSTMPEAGMHHRKLNSGESVTTEEEEMQITDDSTNQCIKCGMKEFETQEDLQIHMQTHTPQTFHFQCNYCGKGFHSERERRRHRKSVCKICGSNFICESHLTTHEASHTGKVPHKCECGMVFTQRQALLNHQQCYHKAPHVCKYCGQTFSSGPILKSHLNQYHRHNDLVPIVSEENYECTQCKRRFQTEPALQVHMETHMVHYQCNYCGQDFHNVWEMQKHRKSECKICGSTFICTSHLRTHMAAHTGEMAHKCECGKVFIQRQALLNHQQHYHRVPHICKYCRQTFTSGPILKSHLDQYHRDDEVSHKCAVCCKVFTQKQALLNHQQHYHNVPHICKYCGQSFTSSPILRSHQDQCHEDSNLESNAPEEIYECSQCRCQFQTEPALQVHMESHTVYYHCNYCGMDFHNAWEMQKHRKSKCNICGSTFICESHLTTHTAAHTGEVPHKCEICDQVFTQRQALLNHQQRYHRGKHICKSCGQTFYSYKKLKRHQGQYHTDNDLKPIGKLGDNDSAVPAVYYSTKRSYNESKPWTCTKCTQTFATSKAVAQHLKIHAA